jgi:hypothetical protein
MKRLATLACVGAVALGATVYAGTAGAAISPKLAVTPTTNANGGANLIVSGGSVNSMEDQFQKVQIFVPAEFTLTSPVGGTTVGTVSGRTLARDVDPTQEQSVTGKIVAVGLTDPRLAWENANCDTTTHAAAWMMQLDTMAGQVNVPIFVDRTTGAETAFGTYKLVVCMRPAELPSSDPNRSPFGTKLNSFIWTLTGFTVPTKPGIYRWRSLWTPYAPGSASVNAAGTVEAQSIVRIPPGAMTLAAKKIVQIVNGRERDAVKITGRVNVSGEPAAGLKVGFSHGPAKRKLTRFGSVKTTANGGFLITSRLLRPTYFQAGVTIGRQELGPAGCTPSFGPAVACVDASISGARVLSRLVYVR